MKTKSVFQSILLQVTTNFVIMSNQT